MFYPLYADYEILNKKPIIKISGRNEKGEKIVFEDKNFEPYFYAIPEQDKIEETKKRIENLVVKHNEEKIKNIESRYGESILKLIDEGFYVMSSVNLSLRIKLMGLETDCYDE